MYFESLFTDGFSLIQVYLNSLGGDFSTGIKIGRLLRTKGAWSHVGKRNPKEDYNPNPGECYSACAFAYLVGFYRFYNDESKIGVHRAWKKNEASKSDLDIGQIISALASSYIREMGVNAGLLDLIVQAGKNEIYILNDNEMKSLNITNGGRSPAKWGLELTNGSYYLVGIQDTMYGNGSFILCCNGNDLTFYSIYEAGQEKSTSLANGKWFHSLLIDREVVPLSNLVEAKENNGYLNSAFF